MKFLVIHVFLIYLLLCTANLTQVADGINEVDDEDIINLNQQGSQSAEFNQDDEEPGLTNPPINECDPKLPNLKVGDYFVDEVTTLDKLKQMHKAMILQISKSSCTDCCKGEPVINFVKSLFKDGRIAYKQKKIPIVRIDLDKYPNIPEEEGIAIQSMPQLVLYLNGKYYEYTEHFNVEFFLLFVNRHLFPVVLLKTEEDVEKFRDVSVEWKENTPFYKNGYQSYNPIYAEMQKQTRVIAFVAEKADFKEELKLVEQNALLLAGRDDLRVAKVTNPELVKKYKQKYNYVWFDEMSSNSVVLFKKKTVSDELVHYYDLISSKGNMFNWLNSASLDRFDVLTGNSFKIMSYLRMPMFVAFIHRDHPKYGEDSLELYELLKRVAPMFPNWLFCYAENNFYRQKKREMGISWDEEPAAAAHNLFSSSIPVFPANTPFTEDNLIAFLNACNDGTVDSPEFKFPDVYAKEDL